MNGHGKSDRPVVPEKSSNKIGQPTAEGMEGRGLAKGNLPQQNASRTPSRKDAPVRWSRYVKQQQRIRSCGARRSCTTLKRGAYRAKPVLRVYIPKADRRQRPLGVPALED